jgi:hypothetical protein
VDSNGFKALAFLHFYLCGVVAVYAGITDGEAAFATIIASSLLLTTGVLSALWIHEARGADTGEPLAFAPGGGRAAVIVGWTSIAFAVATRSYHTVYAAYVAVLVLIAYRARSMEAEEQGWRERMHAGA